MNYDELDKAEKRIKKHEGLRLKPYKDNKENLTIGYGHNLENGITTRQAEDLFDDDMAIVQQAIANNLPDASYLPAEKYGVLLELVFWIGIGKVKGFKKMLAALKNKDWAKAADELLDSRLGREYTNRTTELADILRGKNERD